MVDDFVKGLMVESGRWRRWRLVSLAAGLPMVEIVLIGMYGPAHARALAPQASALAPFGVFHDLRWILVYHRSWIYFVIEIVIAIAVRGALIGYFVHESWPDDVPQPATRTTIIRGILFTGGATLLLVPWAIIMFAQAVIPVSWFFFAAIPPFLVVAILIQHASVASWLRRPPLRVFGLVVLSFVVLSIAGAFIELSSTWAGVLIAGAAGLFNAWAWLASVRGVLVRQRARKTVLVPALLIAFLAVVVGGSAIGFAAHAPRTTGHPTNADADRTGQPVLIVKGFGGSYAGGPSYNFGSEFVTRRYSYAGSTASGLPLPYKPADTTAPLAILVQRMDAQVRALTAKTKRPVSIVAESEGSIVAERYLETHPAAPVRRLIVLSPIVGAGSVYYPPRGSEGWGVAAGWGLRGLASVLSAVSPLRFEADAPLVRDVVDSPQAFGNDCWSASVSRIEFVPLADALAARDDGIKTPDTLIVTAFHGGMLGDRAVRSRIRSVLLDAPQPESSLMRTLDKVVWAGAGAWRVPPLQPSLNPAWRSVSCP